MRTPRPRGETEVMSLRSIAVVPAALIVVGAAQARPDTTVPTVVLSIHVTMTDSRITLDPQSAPRGVEGRFVIKNVGTRMHNFTLDIGPIGAGSTRLLTRTLAPHRQAIVPLFLDYRAKVHYLDRLPADRSKPGMCGVLVVR
jgi:hypothetical protein